MRQLFLAGAALSLLALATPASAMPVDKIAPGLANDQAGEVQVRHRSQRIYAPRQRYVQRRYYSSSPAYSYGYSDGPTRDHDWHSGSHVDRHDQLHYDPYNGLHAGDHYGPHSGEHHDEF